MFAALPSLGWAGASLWSLLLCFGLPALLLYSACLALLTRCRFRLRLLSIHCLPTSRDWARSWPLTRLLARTALCAPFVLLPVSLSSLCALLLLRLPALFASCCVALLLGCAACGALCCYCAARRWQSDAFIAAAQRAVCGWFTCTALSVLPLRLGSSFVGWSCLFLGCNALLLLHALYAVRPNLADEAAAALALPKQLRLGVEQAATPQRNPQPQSNYNSHWARTHRGQPNSVQPPIQTHR